MSQRYNEKVFEIYRYNDKNKEYKTVRLEKSNDGSFFLVAMAGTTGKDKVRVVVKLTDQELAYISMACEKAFKKM